ncbi:2936_t:CDS:2, partial [Acaulospora colombiana]
MRGDDFDLKHVESTVSTAEVRLDGERKEELIGVYEGKYPKIVTECCQLAQFAVQSVSQLIVTWELNLTHSRTQEQRSAAACEGVSLPTSRRRPHIKREASQSCSDERILIDIRPKLQRFCVCGTRPAVNRHGLKRMPHKPNPIPRFHGNSTTKSNRQIQDRIPPGTPDSSSQSLHQSDNTLLQRHRTDSWASQSSAGHDTAARTSMPSTPSSSGHTKPSSGGGRAGGRALPPPRFQRKQRPPRVQQAIAAANAASAASGPSGTTTSRRVAPPAPTGPLGVGGGTLTLGPANNWGAGTTSVTSLPMSAINAASARGSALDRGGPFVLEGGLQPDTRLLLDGLDPVQLHNRLTMGNAAGSNETGFIPAYTQYLPEMSYGHADIQTSPAKNLGTSHATRPRSQSHNVAQPV